LNVKQFLSEVNISGHTGEAAHILMRRMLERAKRRMAVLSLVGAQPQAQMANTDWLACSHNTNILH